MEGMERKEVTLSRLRAGTRCSGPPSGLARLRDVAGLRSLRTVDDLEFDLLAFLERPEPRALDRGEVNEHVVPAFAFDESIALGVVKPLDLAGDAHSLPALRKRGGEPPRRTPAASSAGTDGVHKKGTATCGSDFDASPLTSGGMLVRG